MLYTGNCLDHLALLGPASIDLVVTSPPYPGNPAMWGEAYKAENFHQAHDFLQQVWQACVTALRPGCKLCINVANTNRRPYLPNTAKVYEFALQHPDLLEPTGEIIWNKGYNQNGTAWGSYCNPSDPALADQHEYILIFRKKGERAKRTGRFLDPQSFRLWRNSIWKIPPAKASRVGHVAPFPLEIPRRLILLYTYPGETVYDPFMGSGTTAVAAQQTRREWLGSEINPHYAQLALRRVAAIPPDMFAPEDTLFAPREQKQLLRR